MEQNLQLAILFCSGYLVSRLLVKAGAPERLVARMFVNRPSHGRVILYLVAGTAALSAFIPNAVTVITVLPVLALVRERLVGLHPEYTARVTTLLALAVIYGANIGGMASITATPANAVLAVFATVAGIPGEGVLSFHHWLAWGVPLVVVMVAVSWVVLSVGAGPRLARERLPSTVDRRPRGPLERIAWRVCAGFLAGSFALSALMSRPGAEGVALGLTAVLGAALTGGLFLGWGSRRRVLEIGDCYRGLPLRGLAFVGVVALVALTFAALGMVEAFAAYAGRWLPAALDAPAAFVKVALMTSFATELFSNTVIQIAMLETLSTHAPAAPALIYPMLVVTLSCTCAFMSPIATGVNGLVFGELRGASLARMLVLGLAMNIAGAAVVGLWVFAFVR